MNQNQKHQVGDRMLADLLESLGLSVDGKAIAAAVRERGFDGAQFVAVSLATAAHVEVGLGIERAIDAAVLALEARVRDLERVGRKH